MICIYNHTCANVSCSTIPLPIWFGLGVGVGVGVGSGVCVCVCVMYVQIVGGGQWRVGRLIEREKERGREREE